MKSETYPLTMPDDLFDEVRNAARQVNLSVADTVRQSIRLGLPKLLENSSVDPVVPFSEEESLLAYHTPNPEFDDLEHHCASLPKKQPEP